MENKNSYLLLIFLQYGSKLKKWILSLNFLMKRYHSNSLSKIKDNSFSAVKKSILWIRLTVFHIFEGLAIYVRYYKSCGRFLESEGSIPVTYYWLHLASKAVGCVSNCFSVYMFVCLLPNYFKPFGPIEIFLLVPMK